MNEELMLVTQVQVTGQESVIHLTRGGREGGRERGRVGEKEGGRERVFLFAS